MRALKRFLLAVGVLAVGTVVGALVLYQFFGLRVRLDGGGNPRAALGV